MAHIYPKKKTQTPNPMQPNKETIQFLMNYSRALRVFDSKNGKFETLLN